MNIGEHIKECRKAAGLTQKELAQKCNLATGTIQQYELNKRQPRLEQLQIIADVLGVHTEVLLGEISRKISIAFHTDTDIYSAFATILKNIYGEIDVIKKNGNWYYTLGDCTNENIISQLTYDNLTDSIDYFIKLYINTVLENNESQACYNLIYEIKDMDLKTLKKIIEYAKFLNSLPE